jgi:hypothetical protein
MREGVDVKMGDITEVRVYQITLDRGTTLNNVFNVIWSIVSSIISPKMHVILRNYVVLTWTYDKREVVEHVTLWNNTKSTLQ